LATTEADVRLAPRRWFGPQRKRARVHLLKTPNSTPGAGQGTEFAVEANVRSCADAMRRTKARRIVPSLSFVQTLRSKEATKWTGHRARRFLDTLFTARWN